MQFQFPKLDIVFEYWN